MKRWRVLFVRVNRNQILFIFLPYLYIKFIISLNFLFCKFSNKFNALFRLLMNGSKIWALILTTMISSVQLVVFFLPILVIKSNIMSTSTQTCRLTPVTVGQIRCHRIILKCPTPLHRNRRNRRISVIPHIRILILD